jgi:hypothetical protein
LKYRSGGDGNVNNDEDLKILGKYRMKGYSFKEINHNPQEKQEEEPI